MSARNPTAVRNSPFPADYTRLMSEKITVERQTGQDQYGEPTFGDPFTIQCSIESHRREIRTKDGRTRTTSVRIYLKGMSGLQPQDRITLPSGDQPTIAQIDSHDDTFGPLYEEVLA